MKLSSLLKKFIEENAIRYQAMPRGWKRKAAKEFLEKYPHFDTTPEKLRYRIRYMTKSSGDRNRRKLSQNSKIEIESNKKYSKFNWRDPIKPLKDLQNIYKEGKNSQDFAYWKIKTKNPICVVVLGDLHMGSWATDYDLLQQITDEIVNTPNLYCILVGDLLQMSIKLRGVLEVSDNALPPKWQIKFLESWLKEVYPKIICSTWDNHSVMREENATGFSQYAELMGRVAIYHDNIGHTDIHVNNQIYKVAAAHFFRGRTIYNPVHGQMRYMRMTSNDREICVAGDSHEPGVLIYNEGGTKKRVAINCGSIQNGGYGKRFFSLLNSPVFPCFTLHHEYHEITPYWSVKEWLNAKQ